MVMSLRMIKWCYSHDNEVMCGRKGSFLEYKSGATDTEMGQHMTDDWWSVTLFFQKDNARTSWTHCTILLVIAIYTCIVPNNIDFVTCYLNINYLFGICSVVQRSRRSGYMTTQDNCQLYVWLLSLWTM